MVGSQSEVELRLDIEGVRLYYEQIDRLIATDCSAAMVKIRIVAEHLVGAAYGTVSTNRLGFPEEKERFYSTMFAAGKAHLFDGEGWWIAELFNSIRRAGNVSAHPTDGRLPRLGPWHQNVVDQRNVLWRDLWPWTLSQLGLEDMLRPQPELMRPGGNLQVQRIVEPVSQISAPAGVLRGAIQDAENVILAVTFHASTKLMGMDGTVLAAVQGACVDVVLAPNASRLAWCTDDSLWTVDLAEGGGVLHRWSSTCVGSTGLFAVEGVVGKEKRAFLATIDGGFESLNWDSYGVERAPVNTGGSIGRVVSVGTDWQGGYLVVDDAGHLTGSGSLEILAERWAGDQWIAVDVVRRGDVVVAVGMTRGDDRATIRLGRIRNGELVDGTVSAAGAEAVAYVVRRPGNGVPARVIVSSVGQTSLYDIADVLGA